MIEILTNPRFVEAKVFEDDFHEIAAYWREQLMTRSITQ